MIRENVAAVADLVSAPVAFAHQIAVRVPGRSIPVELAVGSGLEERRETHRRKRTHQELKRQTEMRR